MLKSAGVAAAATGVGSIATGRANASIDVSSGDGYEIWTIEGQELYDLSDGETLSNVLVDQRADGASLTIRSRNKTGWTVRNVGFLGVGEVGGSNRFQLQVSAPSGGHGLVENLWANGKARDGQSATELGGIYVRSGHAGHLDIRHTYIEGFGNNAVYASAVGKDSGADGSVRMENCYHRDNTSTQFRIGSPNSVVRNCVGVVDDPDGDRGTYPGSNNHNARGIWGKHFRDQVIENSSFYVSPDDINPDGAFEARYITDRSHGDEAVVEVIDCDLNADAPTLSGSTSNARVNFTDLGESPTVTVIQDGGVPLSPEMAASGGRSMPPELPGADNTDPVDDSDPTDDSTSGLDRTLTVDGSDAGWTEYEFTVSGDIENNPDIGSFDGDDSIDGSTATGFVNGGVDGYVFSGDIVQAVVEGGADIVLDGAVVDPSTLGDADPTVTTGSVSDVTASETTLSGTLDSLGGAASAEVGFEWRSVGASGWNSLDAGSLSASGPFSASLTDLSADTDYEFRATVTASDGDTATGSTVGFSTGAASTLDRTLTVDGSDAGKTNYEFTVTGDLAENPDVGSLGGADSIDGSTATGFVNGGSDGYRFSGEVDDITVDGGADIVVDGEVVDPDTLGNADLDRTLTIDGSDAGWTEYEFTVSGEIENNTDVGSFDEDDSIDGSTATGFVNGGVDGYVFSGEIVAIAVEGDADLVLDGQVVDPDSVVLPNKLVFEADGSSTETVYAFEVSGELVNDTALGALERGEGIDGSTAAGSVTGDDRDGFRFAGDLLSLELDGDASVIFEDNDG